MIAGNPQNLASQFVHMVANARDLHVESVRTPSIDVDAPIWNKVNKACDIHWV